MPAKAFSLRVYSIHVEPFVGGELAPPNVVQPLHLHFQQPALVLPLHRQALWTALGHTNTYTHPVCHIISILTNRPPRIMPVLGMDTDLQMPHKSCPSLIFKVRTPTSSNTNSPPLQHAILSFPLNSSSGHLRSYTNASLAIAYQAPLVSGEKYSCQNCHIFFGARVCALDLLPPGSKLQPNLFRLQSDISYEPKPPNTKR